MAEQNLKSDLGANRRSLNYTSVNAVVLVLCILGYTLLYRTLIIDYFPLAAIITLLLIPIFSYLLQRKILLLNENGRSWITMVYSVAMILLAAIGVSLLEYVAALLHFEWYFLEGQNVATIRDNYFASLWSYIYWYMIVGIPGTVISRFVLYLQLR